MRVCTFLKNNYVTNFVAQPRVKKFFIVLAKTVFSGGCSLRSSSTRNQWKFVFKKDVSSESTRSATSSTSDDDIKTVERIISKHPEFPLTNLEKTIAKASRIADKILERPEMFKSYESMQMDAINQPSLRDLLFKRCFKSLMELKLAQTNKDFNKVNVGKSTRKLFGSEVIQLKRKDGKMAFYAIQGSIGSGTSNKAFFAIDLFEEKFRVLRKNKYENKDSIKSLKRENSLQIKIRQYQELKKNVVKLHTEIYRNPYFGSILEYCDGGTISNAKMKGLLSLQDKQKIIGEVFKFIKDLHARKIVYGDFKTENLFIKDGNNLKAGDFGGSYENASETSPFVATCYYLAPESYSSRYTDMQTDCWALGLFLYEMKYTEGKKNREPPYFRKIFSTLNYFRKFNSTDVAKAHELLAEGLENPDSFLNTADPYDQIIMGLLKMNPKHRLSSAEALAMLRNVPEQSFTV